MNEFEYKKIVPRYNQIITTAYKFEEDQTEGGIVNIAKKKNDYSTQQKVVAVGSTAREIKEGDWIEIDFGKGRYVEYSEAFLRKNQTLAGLDPLARASHLNTPGISIRYPIVMIDGVEHFLIYDDDILYKFEPKDSFKG